MSERNPERPAACDLIRETAAACFNVTLHDIDGSAKIEDVVRARGVAMYCIRCVTELSLPQIGRLFCKDHSTVLLACRRVEKVLLEEGDEGMDPLAMGVRAVFAALEAAGLGAVETA